MALNPIIDSRDVRFVLFEQLELEKFCKKYPVYNDFDHDTLESTLDLAEKLAVEKIWPTYKDGDREGCTFVPATKEVKIPKCYKPALDAYYETGFIGAMEDPEIGGMGMPACMYMSVAEMISAANYNIMMYPGLSHGCHGHDPHLRDPGAEGDVHSQDDVRRMGRHHVSDRARCRFRCRRPEDQGGQAGRRHLQDHRPEDIHLLRRQRLLQEHDPPGPRPHRRRPGGHQGHLDLHRSQVPGQQRRLPRRAQ